MRNSTKIAHESASSTRVMLVEDSAVVRGMVRKWLDDIDGVQVVGSADNGQKAIEMIEAAQPDIVILDIEMPVMDGLTALPHLLRLAPKAKVIIASTLSRKNAEISLKAMALGAADYLAKPSFAREGNDARSSFRDELKRKVLGMMAQTARPSPRPSSRSGGNQPWAPMPSSDSAFDMRQPSSTIPKILAIGASTGGPSALTRVFTDLEPSLGKVPVLVVQHMPPTFTALLGEKLAEISGLDGGEAKQGEPVLPGHLYLAPGGFHMRVVRRGTQNVIALDEGPPINHCRPAVDPLFESIAELYGKSTLAAVLTGMGADGANGAVTIADAGGTVFAQDEATSVVWGMPGATAAAGACAALISVNNMGRRLGRALLEGANK